MIKSSQKNNLRVKILYKEKHNMVSHSKKSLKTDYLAIMKQAKKQPGVSELMRVYGQYDELLMQSQAYLGLSRSTETFSVSTSSS